MARRVTASSVRPYLQHEWRETSLEEQQEEKNCDMQQECLIALNEQ